MVKRFFPNSEFGIRNSESRGVTRFVFETPAGWVTMRVTDNGLCELALPCSTRAEAESRLLGKGVIEENVETHVEAVRLAGELRRYFAGERARFTVRVDLNGLTDWQRRVLMKTAEIPYGDLVTYGELAAAVGSSGAARAVGQAMARNPVPIVVPCHRVVAASGKLGGYSAGLQWKQRLLALEGVDLGF